MRGVGYYVEGIAGAHYEDSRLDKTHRVAIIGAGRLGTALATIRIRKIEFQVVALFDNDAAKIGQSLGSDEVWFTM